MKKFYLILWMFPLIYACEKADVAVENPTSNLSITFDHTVDNDSLILDDTYYQNAAGNQYRVTTLKYFVSGLTLYKNGEEIWRTEAKPISIDAHYREFCYAEYKSVPVGSYDSLSIALGVVPEFNYDGAFELSYNDYNMYWPTSMGGGYHFLKFEGHWQDGEQFGVFAFHIGGNANLITLGFGLPLQVSSNQTLPLGMTMNTNEWFNNPYLYDLTVEEGYTMGDPVLMNRLKENGSNAFTMKLLEP